MSKNKAEAVLAGFVFLSMGVLWSYATWPVALSVNLAILVLYGISVRRWRRTG